MFSVQGSTACVWHTIVLVVGLFVVLVSQPRSVFVLTPFLSQYLHNLVKWWNSIYVQASGSMMCKPSLRHAGVLQVPESWLGNGEVVCLPFVLIYVCLDKATCLFVYASVKLRSLKTSWQKKKNLFASIVRNMTQLWLPANSMVLHFFPRIPAMFWLRSFWIFIAVVSV